MAFPPPSNLPDPWIKLVSPALQADFLPLGHQGISCIRRHYLQKDFYFLISSVQSHSHVCLFVHPSTAGCQASLCIINSQRMLQLMSVESVMPSDHLILCHPLLLPPSIFPSFRVFSNQSVLCIRWPKYCSFSFSISPSNEYLELISLRMDWLYLLAVQGTLKSLLQQHSSKASILQRSGFFTVQTSHLYMTTGKTIALTSWTFVSKVMSLLFNMVSNYVGHNLPSKEQAYFNFMAAVILEHHLQ